MTGPSNCPCACHQHRFCSTCGCALATCCASDATTLPVSAPPAIIDRTESPPPSEAAATPRATAKKKTLVVEETLRNYLERIQAECTKEEVLAALDGAYLTDFRLHEIDINNPPLVHHASILAALVSDYGGKIQGVTSENKKKGVYVHALPNDASRETAKVVYIGPKNRFTGHEESKWAVKKVDEVWNPPHRRS